MSGIFPRLIALSLLLVSTAVALPGPEFRRADLSHLPAELRESVERKLAPARLERLSLADIDEILRLLQSVSGVEQVVAVAANGAVEFRARRSKKVEKIVFTGAHALSEGELRPLLGLQRGDVFTPEALLEAGEKIRAAYKNIGFHNTGLDIEYPSDEEGNVSLTVRIDEGPRTLIRVARVISPDVDLNNTLAARLRPLTEGPLTEGRLKDMEARLREFLRSNLHLRAGILGPEIQFNADETRADVNFRLEKVESYSIEFRGQREFSAIDLEDDILELKTFVSSNPNVAAEMAEKIRQAYLARGYARVEVSAEESEGRSPYQRRLLFEITEGPKVRIERVSVNGRISRPSDYYGDYVLEHSSDLVGKGFYNREDLEVGYRNLITELQNQGFLLAKMSSTRTQYNRDRTKITVHMNLDEGPLTIIEKVEFVGNGSIPTARLREDLGLTEGEPLKLSQIDRARNLIKSIYQDNGFIEMQLLGKPEDLVTYNEDNTRVALRFEIQEGPQVRVGSIILDGNSFTRDQVLLNELDFKVGDLLTPSRIDESVSRLQRTGHFSSIEIKTLEEKTNVSNRTVIVRVSERNPGLFTLGTGATNENGFTLRGYTGVAYRNLWGTGRGVSLRVDGNYNVSDLQFLETKVALGYLEPYLLGSRVRGRVNLTRSRLVTSYDTRTASEVVQTTYSLERDFSTHLTGIWDLWSLAAVKDFSIDGNTPDKVLDIAWTGASLDIDYRDNPFNPTKGHLSKIGGEYGSPFLRSSDTIEYWMGNLSFSFYRRLGTSPVIWANQLRGGYLKNLSRADEGGMPYDKKGFVLGGRSTLRGFEAGTSEVFPNFRDLGLAKADDTYLLKTAATMGLVKSELRFPLYQAWGLDGALFYDGGTVQIDGLKFEDNYRDSAGFGIRLGTPVGPLSLEFGFKLDRRESEEPWRFHLSMGAF